MLNLKQKSEDLLRMFTVEVDVQHGDGASWRPPARMHDNGPATLDIAGISYHVNRGSNAFSFGSELVQAAAEMTAWAAGNWEDVDEKSVRNALDNVRRSMIALTRASGRLSGVGDCESCGDLSQGLSRRGWCVACEARTCSRCGENVAQDGSDRCWDCNDACARAAQRRQPNLADMEEQHDALLEALREGVQP